jgi:hypothetical protein
VICSDGTWFTPEHRSKGVVTPSNVYKMACAVKPRAGDDKAQIVLYNKGVGTGGIWDRFAGGAFGRGLFKNIEDAYFFLVHNYTPGDEIYLCGFSRGAYTVRSTAGLIRKCGLLHKIHADKFGDAYKLYRRRDATPDTPEAIKFREDYAQNIRIKFIGVWDTVGALGIPFGFLAFLWMKEKAGACGLAFDNAYFENLVKPNYAGEICRSKIATLYKLIGADYVRPIAQGENTVEFVHASAFERFDDEDLGYRPGNLYDYAVRHGRRPE